jgi:hypothetical protein
MKLTVLHGINPRILKGEALREVNDLKEGFFSFWKFHLSPRKEFVEEMMLVYYPFYIVPYQIKWGKTPFAPGMMVDARFKEFSVLTGVPPRSRVETTNELVIRPTIDEHSAKRFAETKLREAMKRKRAKEILKKSKELSSFEVEELELTYWPFWTIRMEDMWHNNRFIAIDAVLNFRGYNLAYTRFFSGPLYSLIDQEFGENKQEVVQTPESG